jgi:hypothetical protein
MFWRSSWQKSKCLKPAQIAISKRLLTLLSLMQIFGKAVFTTKVPIIGVSACDFASFLQVIVNAVDELVNGCEGCENDPSKSTFSALEVKLLTLLKDGVGGSPSVVFSPQSDDMRSSLDVDVTLHWSFQEAYQLNMDIAAILDGLDIDSAIKNFAKGLIPFEGSGIVDLEGFLSLSLGVGVEYERQSKQFRFYIKGVTGLTVGFASEISTEFTANIGPLSAGVQVEASIGKIGSPITITAGLDNDVNYYISTNSTLQRDGFRVVSNPGLLAEEIIVSVTGEIAGTANVQLRGGLGYAFFELSITDLGSKLSETSVIWPLLSYHRYEMSNC